MMNNVKQVEKFIEAYNHLFGLFELTPEPILVANKDGIICYGNSIFIKLFGYDASDIIGQPIELLIPERYKSQHPGFMAKYCENPQKRPMGTGIQPVGVKLNGDEIFLEISLSPIGEELILCVMKDVTDKLKAKNLDEQHSQLSTMGLLTSGLIHEISNPTQSISIAVDLMKTYIAKYDSDPYISAKLEDISFAANKLGELLDSFRMFMRADDNLEQEDGAISMAIETANRLCSHKLKGVDFIVKNHLGEDDNVPISTNKLAQILINLYSNASYSILLAEIIEPQLITEVFKDEKSCKVIKVCDNGPGIPDNIRDKIFDPMFTTKPSNQGTGLGLNICREMLNQVDGEINLTTDDLDGACFEIRFPQ